MEQNEQYNMEIGTNVAKEGTLIGLYESYAKNLIWFAYRKSEKDIRIAVMDNNNNITAYIDLEDDFLDSELSFVSLPDENTVIVSLSAGQDGSQDFCLEFLKEKLTIIHKLPENLTYTFAINKEDSLLIDFYTAEFYKISNHDFQIKFSKTYPVFENDALSNVWKISDSLGIFSTTEERYYVFKLNTLDLVEELIFEGDIAACHADCCGIDTLYRTGDESPKDLS